MLFGEMPRSFTVVVYLELIFFSLAVFYCPLNTLNDLANLMKCTYIPGTKAVVLSV